MPETSNTPIDYKAILKGLTIKVFGQSDYGVFLFGSRVNGKQLQFSDFDLGFIGETALNPLLRYQLEEEIEESIVPYRVDLVDFIAIDSDFKKEALKNVEIWIPSNALTTLLQA